MKSLTLILVFSLILTLPVSYGETLDTLNYGSGLNPGDKFTWIQESYEMKISTNETTTATVTIEIEILEDISGIDHLTIESYEQYFALKVNDVSVSTHSFYLDYTVIYPLVFPLFINDTVNYFSQSVNEGTSIFKSNTSEIKNEEFVYYYSLTSGDASITHDVVFDMKSGVLKHHKSVDKNSDREIGFTRTLKQDNSDENSSTNSELTIGIGVWVLLPFFLVYRQNRRMTHRT